MRKVVVVLCVACKGVAPCEQAATVAPEIVIGVGEREFVPVQDGDTLPLSFGNQGGQHVWVGAQTKGLNPGTNPILGEGEPGPEILFEFVDENGESVASVDTYQSPMRGTPVQAEIVGLQLLLDYDYLYHHPDAGLTEGLLSVSAVDSCGTVVDASVNAVLDL